MADDRVSATTVINAPAETIFAVLPDPAKHAAIEPIVDRRNRVLRHISASFAV